MAESAHYNKGLTEVGGLIGKLIGSIWGPIGGAAGGAAGTDAGTTIGDALGGDWSLVSKDIGNTLVPKNPMTGMPIGNAQLFGEDNEALPDSSFNDFDMGSLMSLFG